MKKEYREIQLVAPQEESRRVEGKAVCFESWSEDLGFREIIHKGAITQETINNSDIIMCYSHDSDKMLARSKYGVGTLEIELREDGMYIAFDAPTTQLGDEMLYHLRAGNLSSMSFGFVIDQSDSTAQRWYKNEEGILCREINKIALLFDASIVHHPAYEDTNVYTRSKEQAESELAKINAEERKRVEENIFIGLNNKLKNTLDRL